MTFHTKPGSSKHISGGGGEDVGPWKGGIAIYTRGEQPRALVMQMV